MSASLLETSVPIAQGKQPKNKEDEDDFDNDKGRDNGDAHDRKVARNRKRHASRIWLAKSYPSGSCAGPFASLTTTQPSLSSSIVAGGGKRRGETKEGLARI